MTALSAVLAMILAGPIHMLVAHGHHGHSESEVHTVPSSQSHVAACDHARCSGHGFEHGLGQQLVFGPVQDLPTEPESDPFPDPCSEPCSEPCSDPCEDHSGDCGTCMLLATMTPLQIDMNLNVSDRVFLDFTGMAVASVHLVWSGSATANRGPPVPA